eukprot:9753386-Alexandrium_andersonii.AAC.1
MGVEVPNYILPPGRGQTEVQLGVMGWRNRGGPRTKRRGTRCPDSDLTKARLAEIGVQDPELLINAAGKQ